MFIIGLFLIIIGLTKLYSVITFKDIEIKELTNTLPDMFTDILKAVITFDGLLCTMGGLMLCMI